MRQHCFQRGNRILENHLRIAVVVEDFQIGVVHLLHDLRQFRAGKIFVVFQHDDHIEISGFLHD